MRLIIVYYKRNIGILNTIFLDITTSCKLSEIIENEKRKILRNDGFDDNVFNNFSKIYSLVYWLK